MLLKLPSHFSTLQQAVRQEAAPLALALGAWLGALGFFLWPTNPPLVWGLWVAGTALISLAFLPWRSARVVTLALLAMGLWWGLSGWEVARQAAQALPWQQAAERSHWVVGQVAEMRPQADARRITLSLAPLKVFALPNSHTLTSLRVGVWASQLARVAVGGYVAVPVQFIPPQSPAMPHVRDTRLWQWFGPTYASAYASGQLEVSANGAQYFMHKRTLIENIFAKTQEWRRSIQTASQPLGQGVPTALLVGAQGQIPATVREAYRATGLSHLLAISGMQMTLVGLGLFWLLRYAGAAVPTLALRVNLKLWAALLALAGVGGYTLLVGAGPSIVRAALMVGLVLLAVLLGRVRGVLRAWALANLAILALQPHLALSAGLQLSSLATLALGLWAQTAPPPRGPLGWARAMLLSTLVAGAATAPVAVANFGTQAALGLVANMVAIPLMTLASYAGFAALALWPIGLQNLGLLPLEFLSNLTTQWALWLASLQGTPAPLGWWGVALLGGAAVGTLSLAMLRWWRALAGLTLLTMLGLLLWGMLAPQPTLVVAENATAAWLDTAQGYRLLWAASPAEANRLARQGGLRTEATPPQPPACCEDAQFLPNNAQNFAYAQKYQGAWDITPRRCARPWQRVAESCWVK